MAIEISDEGRKAICEALERYMQAEFELDIGLLQSQRLYEFMLGLIGSSVYNQAIDDAQTWMQRRVADLPGDLHEDVEGR